MTRSAIKNCLVAAAAILGTGCCLGSTGFAQPAPPAEQDFEVLARGPVHEAFAETVTFDPQPGITVPVRPPSPIEELPPSHRPEGAHVVWIPGYWAWDDDSNTFLWVSGIWRALPPGRQWIAGYWAPSGKGAQWVSGSWADAGLTDAEYLPEPPPESAEAGPNVPAPSRDSIWLPGGWVWLQNRYVWRPGLWTVAQPNWVWIPAHYLWAPRGYVYVDGYWDYTVDRRGVLFAPVAFHRNVYTQPGFSYTPSIVIDTGVFNTHLFLRPNYGHYYYGDYYNARYTSVGFFPWNMINVTRRFYDPLYAQQRWTHREEPDWERRVETDFQRRRSDEGFRPPHTFSAQQALARDAKVKPDATRVYTQPLERHVTAKDGPVRYQPLKPEDRQRFGQSGRQVTSYREERQKLETGAVHRPADQPAKVVVPARIALPRSPYVGKRPQELDKDHAPPKAHAFPKPDPSVAPKRRQPSGRPTP